MPKDQKRISTGIQSLGSLLLDYNLDHPPKYVSREFQDYGYRLALELDDPKHVSMYIKFAKTIDRSILELARSFVKDAPNVKNKARLFMWKLGELRKSKTSKETPKQVKDKKHIPVP